MTTTPNIATREHRDRWRVLRSLENWLHGPMLVLSFVWLALVVVELTRGGSRLIEILGTVIWMIFLGEFAVRLTLAPGKVRFLTRNWITVLALAAPAFRLLSAFRMLRFIRAARGLRLLQIVTTANRSMNALRMSLARRGFGYIFGLTVLVTLLGAAGMRAFEPASEVQGGFASYADALWWTGMLLTSMGSDFWPKTPEGRILCFLLALYGFAVFGYITASFASFFVERDAASPKTQTVGASDIADLKAEISALRTQLLAVDS